MTETPTPYDLIQDDLILPMRDILLNAAEPPTGAEFSYPVVGQGINSSMHQWITLGMGSGILDAGGQPYWLRNNGSANNTNSSRQMRLTVSTTIGTGNAVIRGYFHQLSADMLIEFPMPSSGTVTYYVCLTYDPRNESATGGPVSVQRYSGPPPSSFGRSHIVLWTVRCAASQLLTDAVMTQVRPKIAPTLTVDSKEQLDLVDPASVLWGTRVVLHQGRERGAEYFADGASAETGGPTRWETLTSPTPTTVAPHPWNRVYASGADVLNGARVGDRVRLAGKVERTNGEAYTPRADGWPVCTLPAALRPLRWGRYPVGVSVDVSGRPIAAIVDITTDGVVTAYINSPAAYLTLDGIAFRGA